MKPSFWALLLLLVGWLSACSAVNVEQRRGTDFSQYRTFAWAETEVKTSGDQNPLLRSKIAQANIRQAIESELAKRGLTPNETNPDLYLTTHIYVEEAERTVANPPATVPAVYPYLVRYRGFLVPVNYGYWYTPIYNTGYRTERYREGTLILDFIDAKTNNLVWRGSIANPIDNPARLGKQFAKAAREILEKYPANRSAAASGQ